MSNRPQTRVNRHFKALARWAEYQASKPILWAKVAKPARQEWSGLVPAERYRFKWRLFWKYGGAFCLYCGRSMPLEHLTIDHIHPLSKGGAVRDIGNMVLACLGCNREKGNQWESYTTEL